MKQIIISIILLIFLFFNVVSQEVSNIQFDQQDKRIIVKYDLKGNTNIDYFNIEIFYSLDEGYKWIGPLKYVSGDVGVNQKAGHEKTIVWDALKEATKLTGNVKFQIKAKPHYVNKKTIEKSRKYMIGFKGGLNISKRLNYIEVYIKSKTGFNIGMFHKFQFNNVFGFQSELLFDRKGYTFDLSQYGEDELYPVSIDYFTVLPFLLNPSFGSRNTRFYFELGPFAGILLNRKKVRETLRQIDKDYSISYLDTGNPAIDCGFILGIGSLFYLPKSCLILNFRYSLGWLDNYEFNMGTNGTNSCLSFNIGILF